MYKTNENCSVVTKISIYGAITHTYIGSIKHTWIAI